MTATDAIWAARCREMSDGSRWRNPFYAVGLCYESISQTTDEEAPELLARAENKQAAAAQK